MPMPYSHLSLAHNCMNNLTYEDKNDFYLGAIMPDIRYFTREPRNKYHFSIDNLNKLTSAIEVPRSFVLGYGIHLLIDEIWGTDELRDEYKERFPSFMRGRINTKILEVALEIFCLSYRPVNTQLVIQENELTKMLGINKSESLSAAISLLQRYIDKHNLKSGLQIAEASGMYTPDRLAQMRSLSNVLERRLTSILIHLLIVSPSRHIYQKLTNDVLSRVNEILMP